MEFREALKALRRELGITQVEIANALHVNVITISRWELGKTFPNPAVVSLLMGYAYTHAAPKHTVDALRQSTNNMMKQKKNSMNNGLSAVEHSSLARIVECLSFPLYVCDAVTNDILYANKKACEVFSIPADSIGEAKCYTCVMQRETPCNGCERVKLSGEAFTRFGTITLPDGVSCDLYGKPIKWNGHDAQVRYLLEAK